MIRPGHQRGGRAGKAVDSWHPTVNSAGGCSGERNRNPDQPETPSNSFFADARLLILGVWLKAALLLALVIMEDCDSDHES